MGGRAGIAKVRVKLLDKSLVLRLVFCTAAANAAAINLMYLQTASLVSSCCQGRSKKKKLLDDGLGREGRQQIRGHQRDGKLDGSIFRPWKPDVDFPKRVNSIEGPQGARHAH